MAVWAVLAAALSCILVAHAKQAERPSAAERGAAYQAAAREASSSLQAVVPASGSPPSLLQTMATSRAKAGLRSAVPSGFFEDAASRLGLTGARKETEVLPFDVGNNAVPLPNEFESPSSWALVQQSLDRLKAQQSKQLSLAATKAEQTPAAGSSSPQTAALAAGHEAFDDRLPPGADLNPLLLEQSAGVDALLKQQTQQQQLQLQQQQEQQRLQQQRQAQETQQAAEASERQQLQEQVQELQKQLQQEEQKQLQQQQQTLPPKTSSAVAEGASATKDPVAEAMKLFETSADVGKQEVTSNSQVHRRKEADAISEDAVPRMQQVFVQDADVAAKSAAPELLAVQQPFLADAAARVAAAPAQQQQRASAAVAPQHQQPQAASWLEDSAAAVATSAASYEDHVGGAEQDSAAASSFLRSQASQQAQMAQAQLAARRYQALLAEQQRRQRERQAAIQRAALAQRRAEMDQRVKKLQDEALQLQAMEQDLLQNISGPSVSAPSAAAPQQQASWNTAARTFLHRPMRDPAALAAVAAAPPPSASVVSLGQSSAQAPREEEYMPRQEHCTPQCSYKCTNPVCEEECHPVCETPNCQTRCSGTDLSQCRMNCGKPQCAVVCPERPCSGENCPACTTHCSEPMCMLQCPKAQPCHNICEQPSCTWKCKAPSLCPKPTCSMSCETPSGCMGSTHRELPPLRQGEVLVQSFAAPSGGGPAAPSSSSSASSASSLRGPAASASAPPAGGAAMAVDGADAGVEAATMTVPVLARREALGDLGREPAAPVHQQWMVQMPAVSTVGDWQQGRSR